MRMKEESEKAGLKLIIQKTKITAYDPITSWEIDGDKMETVADFIFLGSKITENGDCSHEIKRNLLLRKKGKIDIDSILKSRDITNKGLCNQSYGFPVVMYGCESWTIKKAEHQGIDVFKLWCLRKSLRVTWTARRSNQSILKEVNNEYSLKGLMLQLMLP